MHSTQYLYDCEPTEFMNLTYVDALHYKIDKTEKLITKLLEPYYTERDFTHLRQVQIARNFNQELIKELNLPKKPKIKLNKQLLKRQGISKETEQAIIRLHRKMDKLKDLSIGKIASIPVYVKDVQNLEFKMQEQWKFDQNSAFHTHWFYDPKCTCPVMDNQDMLGIQACVISKNCPLHGDLDG